MVDGLPSHLSDIGSESIKNASISNADLADSAASGAKVDNTIPTAYTGSPSSANQLVQAGNVSTGAGSEATIEFGKQFANGNYRMALTAGSDNGGSSAYVSGVRNVSGCNVVGEASVPYNYIAVGDRG